MILRPAFWTLVALVLMWAPVLIERLLDV